MNGQQVVSQGGGFVYDNHRWIENDKFTETANGLSEKGTCTVTEEKGNIIVTTNREGSLCSTDIVYTFTQTGVMDMEVVSVRIQLIYVVAAWWQTSTQH